MVQRRQRSASPARAAQAAWICGITAKGSAGGLGGVLGRAVQASISLVTCGVMSTGSRGGVRVGGGSWVEVDGGAVGTDVGLGGEVVAGGVVAGGWVGVTVLSLGGGRAVTAVRDSGNRLRQ